MFLAIAVDNLGTAQQLTQQQEEAEELAREQKEKNLNSEVNKFQATSINPEVTNPNTENNEIEKNDKSKDKGKTSKKE